MGHYTVKSAYTAICAQKEENQGSDNSGLWRKMWNLKIPLKVKHFLWRVLTGCLPTKSQLIEKRVGVNHLCLVCNLHSETIVHALVDCKLARQCWDRLKCMKGQVTTTSFIDWFSYVLQECSSSDVKKISMVCWSLWRNRNNIVWNQKSSEFEEIVMSGVSTLNNWQSAQDKTFDHSFGFITQTDGDACWHRPQENTVKVNTDITIFEDPKRYSYAMLARDHNGNLLEAVSCCKTGGIKPDLCEAIGIREALSWIKAKMWMKVVLETDCLVVTQAIRCSSINLSYLGRVVDECKQLLSELENRQVILKFVRRSANRVAHFIARYSSSVADRKWGGGIIHPELTNVLMDDLKF